MKQILYIPLALTLAALIGYAVSRAAGIPSQAREIVGAFIPSLVAGMAALLPALAQRPHGQAAVVQGAFQGMVIHIGLSIALAFVFYLLLPLQGAASDRFAIWLLWFFAVTLLLVAASLIRVIRRTPAAGSPATGA